MIIRNEEVAALTKQLHSTEKKLRDARCLLKQALDAERLDVFCTALEMIRDTRSEDGSKLITGRQAVAIASAALDISEDLGERA